MNARQLGFPHSATQGTAPNAVERISEAIEQARTIGNLHEEIAGLITLAWVLWTCRDRGEGLRESLHVLDLVEEMRALQTADEERARISSTWSYAFYQPIGRLLGTGDPGDRDLALQIMERLRANGLVDLLDAADAPSPDFIDAAVLIDHLYRHLAAGMSVADALAQAQRERWAAGDSTTSRSRYTR